MKKEKEKEKTCSLFRVLFLDADLSEKTRFSPSFVQKNTRIK
jgi:hypothetical protein